MERYSKFGIRKKRSRKLFRRSLALCVYVLFVTVGCESEKPRFTDEQMALIPMPQKTGLPEPSGGVSLAVGNEVISAEEFIAPVLENFKPSARGKSFEEFEIMAKPALRQYLTNEISGILLYRQAKREVGDQVDEALEKLVDSEIKKFIVSFENDYARAEHYLREEMSMDWQSFRKFQKKNILTQSYLSSQLPEVKVVTYSELVEYYNNNKEKEFSTPAKITFRLIDIQPSKIKVSDANVSAVEQAGTLANELLDKIRAGEDFAKLAKEHSHGHRRSLGGLWEPVRPGSLAEPWDVLAKEAEKMSQGEVSGAIETDEHVFIMKLESKQLENVRPFEKVQKTIEVKITLQRRKEAVDKISDKIAQKAEIGNKEKFIDYCLRQIHRKSNQ